MATNLTTEMTAASNKKEATIQLVKQAVADLITLQDLQFKNEDDIAKEDEAKDHLIQGIHVLRVVDVAPFIKEFNEEIRDDDSRATDLRNAILKTLEERIDLPSTDLNEKIVDHLALASIHESTDTAKTKEINDTAYFLLGEDQKSNVPRVVESLEYVSEYYPKDPHNSDAFTLSILQMVHIDEIIITKANDYLAANKKSTEMSERFITLALKLEDDEAYCVLAEQLFDYRTQSGQVEYIQGLVKDGQTHEADETAVRNPILARFGKTYGEVTENLERVGGTVDQLLGFAPKPPEPNGQKTLDLN